MFSANSEFYLGRSPSFEEGRVSNQADYLTSVDR